MEKDVQNIGTFNYLLTILTGKNRQISTLNKRDWRKDSEINSETVLGDYKALHFLYAKNWVKFKNKTTLNNKKFSDV